MKRGTPTAASSLISSAAARGVTLRGPDFAAVQAVLATVDVPVIYAGGVSSIADLVRLASLGAEAAIIGQALYTGAVDFQQALKVLSRAPRPERGFHV